MFVSSPPLPSRFRELSTCCFTFSCLCVTFSCLFVTCICLFLIHSVCFSRLVVCFVTFSCLTSSRLVRTGHHQFAVTFRYRCICVSRLVPSYCTQTILAYALTPPGAPTGLKRRPLPQTALLPQLLLIEVLLLQYPSIISAVARVCPIAASILPLLWLPILPLMLLGMIMATVMSHQWHP